MFRQSRGWCFRAPLTLSFNKIVNWKSEKWNSYIAFSYILDIGAYWYQCFSKLVACNCWTVVPHSTAIIILMKMICFCYNMCALGCWRFSALLSPLSPRQDNIWQTLPLFLLHMHMRPIECSSLLVSMIFQISLMQFCDSAPSICERNSNANHSFLLHYVVVYAPWG